MIANILANLRRLGRRRILRKRLQAQLAELKRRKLMMEEDQRNMRHWPGDVQERLQEQIYALQARIETLHARIMLMEG